MENEEELTHREFINSFLYYHPADSVEVKLYRAFHIDQDSPVIEMLEWLGIFSDEKIGITKGTPAQMLETILRKKWTMKPDDKDLVVMWHKFNYMDKTTGKEVVLTSSMGISGENPACTAMSKCVGLPLGIAAKRILTGKLQRKGLIVPTLPDIYHPVLRELEENGIRFIEKEIPFNSV
jgi:saccharopine dehydrogenase (NAD+, L-glutamate forming)